MARPKKVTKKIDGEPGRNEATINWDSVEELLMCGCSGRTVAEKVGVCPDTLYTRIEKKYGVIFSDFLAIMREKGNDLLKSVQFKKAAGLSEKGDNTLLIWLGKNRLGQREQAQEDQKTPRDEIINLQDQLIRSNQKLRELEERVSAQSKTGV